MKPFFLLSFFLMLIMVSSAQGVTVINSKYTATLPTGGSASYVMTLKPDTLAETGSPLSIGMDQGNCSQWVTLDQSTIILTREGTPITASIKVPSGAYNGLYQCFVMYTPPSSGMVQSRITIPITLTVTGGTNPPITTAPTPTPTITPTHTITITPTPTGTKTPKPKPTYSDVPAWLSIGTLSLIPIIKRVKK